ncbi:hypothetical protein N658DRAFT_187265 [Parathielavia hyrcaniae]|uniref:Uncharacterized protein n=1 Tax=Parathielavia hyrcaniae TaxID=113614 RepID=A0AAN6Q875_9PEZI|nr:hypothetical protein N658DRAFT_187265 [Parathielavia hyrcaniae]
MAGTSSSAFWGGGRGPGSWFPQTGLSVASCPVTQSVPVCRCFCIDEWPSPVEFPFVDYSCEARRLLGDQQGPGGQVGTGSRQRERELVMTELGSTGLWWQGTVNQPVSQPASRASIIDCRLDGRDSAWLRMRWFDASRWMGSRRAKYQLPYQEHPDSRHT